MKLIYTKWFNVECCKGCDKQLTKVEVMYSSGCCPYCGHNPKPSTICDVRFNSARNVYERVYLLGFIPWKRFIKTERK